MKQRIAEGGVARVWFLAVDRFARDEEIGLRICRQFLEHGTVSHFIETPADITTPEGKFQFTQYLAFAAFEHARIKKRTTDGRLKKLEKGVPDCWCASYGWGVKNDTPYVKEDEKRALNQIFRWRQAGKSIYELVALATAAGFKPQRGRVWRRSSMTNLLTNRCAIAEYHRCGKVFALPFTLVDPALFHDVQRRMAAVKERRVGRPTKDVHFLLRGLAVCAVCKRRLLCSTWSKPHGDYRYYRCQGSIRKTAIEGIECRVPMWKADGLEEASWGPVWELLKNPAYFRKLAEALAAEEAKKAPKLNRDPQWELENARAEEKQILEMTRARMYTVAEGSELIKGVRRRISSLEMEVRSIEKVIALPPLNIIEAACRAFADGEEPFDYEDRREVLDGLLDFQVEVAADGKHATVTGRLPLPAVEVIEPADSMRKKNRSNELPRPPSGQNSANGGRGREDRIWRCGIRVRRLARAGNREGLRRILALREYVLYSGILPALHTGATRKRRRRTLGGDDSRAAGGYRQSDLRFHCLIPLDRTSQFEFVQRLQFLPTNIAPAFLSPLNVHRSQFDATLANSPPPG
jgi:hypothetical protein